MSQLSLFSPEDAELLVSLPYRVGVSISFTEDEEGEGDDDREMEALESCIKEVAKLHQGSAIVSEVARRILESKSKWEAWSNQGVFNIAPECERAVRALKPVVNAQELKSYKKMILEIATAVAQASGEFGDVHKKKGFFGKVMEKVVGGFANDDGSHPMNVSAAENDAIKAIKSALSKVE